ncbi:hypothetical protein E5Q_06739 [Mixia osmundae IAM 14324]|uniref:Uncharacterized protein n=1 Tax=Mixia osmundae (strain CBS 9802 / IAM 14324 / JCM 22182 / KY 12970) TaxID=764103 RepID=G7EB26_MIXOS|nr:hypothetical protein E5Q_06739 [Mixia osmundae IAM 14324]
MLLSDGRTQAQAEALTRNSHNSKSPVIDDHFSVLYRL